MVLAHDLLLQGESSSFRPHALPASMRTKRKVCVCIMNTWPSRVQLVQHCGIELLESRQKGTWKEKKRPDRWRFAQTCDVYVWRYRRTVGKARARLDEQRVARLVIGSSPAYSLPSCDEHARVSLTRDAQSTHHSTLPPRVQLFSSNLWRCCSLFCFSAISILNVSWDKAATK